MGRLPRACWRGEPPKARPVNETVVRLGPKFLEVKDPDDLFNVNTPDDLLQAAAMLDRRARRVPWAPR